MVLDGDPNGLNVPPPCGEGRKQGWHQLADLGGCGGAVRKEAPSASFDRAGQDGVAKVGRATSIATSDRPMTMTTVWNKSVKATDHMPPNSV